MTRTLLVSAAAALAATAARAHEGHGSPVPSHRHASDARICFGRMTPTELPIWASSNAASEGHLRDDDRYTIRASRSLQVHPC
jgi:hypothetical protein